MQFKRGKRNIIKCNIEIANIGFIITVNILSESIFIFEHGNIG